MKRNAALWPALALIAALGACQSDRFHPSPRAEMPHNPLAPDGSPATQSRPLPLTPSGPIERDARQPGPGLHSPDPLPGAYASAQEKIAAARSTDPDAFKPSGSASPISARSKCGELSRRAAGRGTRVLLIAFEGLVSFDAPGTAAAYRYQLRRAAGDPEASKPAFVPLLLGGYVLHELILPLIDRHGDAFEFLVFRHFEQNEGNESVPTLCAQTWLSGAPGRRLIVVGHSAGGGAASQLARSLERFRAWVDLVVTIDSVWTGGRGVNVRRWENYRAAYPDVPGADVNRFIPKDHFSIPGSPEIVESVSRQLGAMAAVPTS